MAELMLRTELEGEAVSPSTSTSQAEHMQAMPFSLAERTEVEAFSQAERTEVEAFSQATHRPFVVADTSIMDIAEPVDTEHIGLAVRFEDNRLGVTASPRRTFNFFIC